jgi:hypothetical protein
MAPEQSSLVRSSWKSNQVEREERKYHLWPTLRQRVVRCWLDLAVVAMMVMTMAIVVVVIVARIIVVIVTTAAVSAGHLLQILLTQFDLGGLLVAGALGAKCAENIFHDCSSFSFQCFLYF